MNLLIVEDSLLLAQNIAKVFKNTGNFNKIKILSNYIDFLSEYHNINSYDMVLVDLILSNDKKDKNGIDIIRKIRIKNKKLPIIVISGMSDISYFKAAFNGGINDYLVKPFRLAELEIRVNRWCNTYIYSDLTIKKYVAYGNLTKDVCNNEFYYNGNKINLSKSSKFILGLFLANREKLLSEGYLREKIWGDISDDHERNPRVNILRLKKSLELVGISHWLKNIRGEGYLLKKS